MVLFKNFLKNHKFHIEQQYEIIYFIYLINELFSNSN